MTTWTQDTVASAVWSATHSILYLLTEAGENLLDEISGLILIDRKNLPTWTKVTIH